jgi:hypothetical protein
MPNILFTQVSVSNDLVCLIGCVQETKCAAISGQGTQMLGVRPAST